MQEVMATYRDGMVILDTPVDGPHGTRIEVVQLGADGTTVSRAARAIRSELVHALNDPEHYGLDGSLWPRTPQEIELLLRHMDEAQPLQMTDEELAWLQVRASSGRVN